MDVYVGVLGRFVSVQILINFPTKRGVLIATVIFSGSIPDIAEEETVTDLMTFKRYHTGGVVFHGSSETPHGVYSKLHNCVTSIFI